MIPCNAVIAFIALSAMVALTQVPGSQQPQNPQSPAPLPPNQLTPPIQPKTPNIQVPPPVTLPPPPQPTVPNRPLTADEAAQVALAHQPNVMIAAANIVAARGRYNQAQAGLLPQISFNQAYNRQDTYVGNASAGGGGTGGGTGTTGGGTGTTGGTGGTSAGGSGGVSNNTVTGGRPSGFSGGINLNQLIFDFNHTRDIVRENEALVRAARQGYSRTELDTVLAVKQAFYTYLENQRLVGVNESNVRVTQSALDLAQARLNSGIGAPADVVSAKTNLANAVQGLLNARAQALTSKILLAQAMGIDPRTPIVASETDEAVGPEDDPNALVDQAIQYRPDIKQAVETLRAMGFAVSAAKTSNAPVLQLNVSLNNRGPRNPLENQTLSAGVNLVWNFEDAGAAAGRVEEANANRDIAKAQLLATTQQVISDVSQSYVNLKTAEQRVATAEAQVANALEALRLAQGRYQAGFATFVDVITAQGQLLTAQTNQVNARSQLNQARAALRHAVGR